MQTIIRDLNKTLINVLNAFIRIRGFENIEAKCEDIFAEPCDCLVSPANSFGYTDGGIDQSYMNKFGKEIETKVKGIIANRPMKELLVGETILVDTKNHEFPNLLIAPTMREPGPIAENIDVYLASKAAFIRAKGKFNTLVMPGMGTLTGKVREDVAANHMLTAYKEIMGKEV